MMRWAIPVVFAAFAVAVSAAVIGDGATEWVANVVAGHAVDAHQESLLPAAGLAAVMIVVLCAVAAFAGRARAEAFGKILAARPARITFFVVTAVLTLAVVVAMEGYETRFGGTSVFDARSVLAQHWLPSLAAYAFVAALVDRLLRICVRAALAGWEALLRVAAPFVRRRLARPAAAIDLHNQCSLQAGPGRRHPSWSLRAPPFDVHGHSVSIARLRRILWTKSARAHAGARSS